MISRPDDAYDNNEDTEDLDAIADEADPVTDRQFEGGQALNTYVRLPLAGTLLIASRWLQQLTSEGVSRM